MVTTGKMGVFAVNKEDDAVYYRKGTMDQGFESNTVPTYPFKNRNNIKNYFNHFPVT